MNNRRKNIIMEIKKENGEVVRNTQNMNREVVQFFDTLLNQVFWP